MNIHEYKAAPFNLPGVSQGYAEAAGVERLTAAEAEHRCGLKEGGLWFPYRSLAGEPIPLDGRPGCYGRLRLNVPRDDRKYHQRAGTKARGYVPHNFHLLTAQNDLVIVEGEKKCLALAEAGVAALGVGGICSALSDGQFVPELNAAIQHMNLQRVLFLGDSDTSLIFSFSREAIKTARMLPEHITVVLPRIGLDGPGKGIDDVRQALGAEFPAYWARIVAEAEPVSRDDTAEQLALRLFKRETQNALRLAAGQTT